jgi:predicted nucleotide-binding protein
MKPGIFIGSSAKGLPIARAIAQNLKHDAFCDVWPQGIFGLGDTTLDSLLNAVTDHRFGVFVLSPDDITIIRETASSAPRGNALFELALFMGRYG